MNKGRFDERRAGFAVGNGGQYRSGDRSIDNDGVVLLSIRATRNRLVGRLR